MPERPKIVNRGGWQGTIDEEGNFVPLSGAVRTKPLSARNEVDEAMEEAAQRRRNRELEIEAGFVENL